ncbi:MAG: outer membrane beta-barrel protein [Bacteroidales bacterium]|jgi:hypothetical protein|nr:outer membrane beta-barrel protein [Bacteroidales bacterium]
MKRTLIYVVAAFCTVTTAAQENNYTAIQEIKGTINHIKVLSKMNVMVESGTENSVSISRTGGKNDIKSPICKVNGTTLELNNTSEEIQNVNVMITLAEPVHIKSVYTAENSNLMINPKGEELICDNLQINAKPNSNIKLQGEWIVMNTFDITAEENSNIMIEILDGESASKVNIVAEKGANILVKRGELGEMTKVYADIANSSGVKIPGKEFKTVEKSTYYYDMKEDVGVDTVITTTTVENTSKDADKKSDKSEKPVHYPNVKSVKLGWNLSYLSGSNNPKSLKDIFNTGNTDLSLAGGTRWGFTFIIPINFSQHFSLNTGIGMEFNWFSFEKKVSAYRNTSNGTYALAILNTAGIYSDLQEYQANLYANYFTVPLVFQWQSGKKIAINLGIIGGLKYFSSFKTCFEAEDVEINAKFSDYNNINPLKADAVLGFTYSDFGINFRYALTPLFKSGREEIVYPFSVGICWGI